MATAEVTRLDRIERRRVDKFNERRMELASAAVVTLADLGYARTSLREIAQNSEFSHGVLHYYFADKMDLITCCVRLYKSRCVTRYDSVVAESTTFEQLLEGFLEVLGATMREEADLHRLWYDLRSQSLFETALRQDVIDIDSSLEAMICRVIAKLATLDGNEPPMPPPLAYAIFDGLFQQFLLKHICGDIGAIGELKNNCRIILQKIFDK